LLDTDDDLDGNLDFNNNNNNNTSSVSDANLFYLNTLYKRSLMMYVVFCKLKKTKLMRICACSRDSFMEMSVRPKSEMAASIKKAQSVCNGGSREEQAAVLAGLITQNNKQLNSTAQKSFEGNLAELAQRLANRSQRNLSRALLMCEAKYYPFADDMDISEPDWEVFLRETARMAAQQQSVERVVAVRDRLYELLCHCIPADVIFRGLLKEVLAVCEEHLKPMVVGMAAELEHKTSLTDKQIFYLNEFVVNGHGRVQALPGKEVRDKCCGDAPENDGVPEEDVVVGGRAGHSHRRAVLHPLEVSHESVPGRCRMMCVLVCGWPRK
jgi:hypothetical protein